MSDTPENSDTALVPIVEAVNGVPFTAPQSASQRASAVDENRGTDKPKKGGGGGTSKGKKQAAAKGEPCPVIPLGHCDGVFHFISPSGQLRSITDDKLGNKRIIGLFEDRDDWLMANFAKHRKVTDEETGEEEFVPIPGKWDPERAQRQLVRDCAVQGIFVPEKMLRSTGVWRAEDNKLIVHCGDMLLVPEELACGEGEKFAAGFVKLSAGRRLENNVYPATVPEGVPALDQPATQDEAELVMALLRSWNWHEKKYASRLWLGFATSAMVSGSLEWRPHIHVSGDAGTGKTKLAEVFNAICGKAAALSVSAPSEAGVRQALKGSARPVMIDEVEPSIYNDRARQVQELARLASSDKQGAVVRGSSGGQVQSYPIRGSFYMTSILHPEPAPQDRQRITFLELDPLQEHKEALEPGEMLSKLERIAKLSLRFRARMILGHDRIRQNFEVFYKVLANNDYTRRQIDQLATLLACAEAFLFDEPIDADSAEELVNGLGFGEVEETDADHDECLNHLLSSYADLWRGGAHKTVQEVFIEACLSSGTDARASLRTLGIALEPNNENWLHAHIANRHQALQKMYRDTRWAGAVHAQALKRLPGASVTKKTVSIGGVKTRATIIPRDAIVDAKDVLAAEGRRQDAEQQR